MHILEHNKPCYNFYMTNPFPILLIFGLLAPLLLRVTLGLTFIHFGGKHIKSKKSRLLALGIIEIIGGALLVIGLYTQIAALVFSVILGVELIKKIKNREFLTDGVNYYLLLFVIAVSLLLSGAGLFAIDYPL